MSDWIEGLERLKALRAVGDLSETEYEAAKARVLGLSNRPAAPHVEEPPQLRPDFPTESVTHGGDRSWEAPAPSVVKRLLIGLAVTLPILAIFVWAIGKFDLTASGAGTPTAIAHQCVGLSAGDTVMRPNEADVTQLTTLMNSPQMKSLAPSTVKESWGWSDEGTGHYTLTGTTTDDLTKSEVVTKWSFRRVAGAGDLKSCGPDTLAFEREIVDGRDSGQEAVKRFLMALLMASNLKRPSAAAAPTSVSVTETPAVTPSANAPASVTDAQGAAFHDASSSGPRAAALAGVWVPQGSYCASGDPMVLNRNGTFKEESSAGKWKLVGDTLTIDDGDEPISGTVSDFSGKQLDIVWTGGKKFRYRRCPSDFSSEPWYPAY